MAGEPALTLKIRKGLETKGAAVAKIHGGMYSAGVSDLLVCWESRFFAMEVKLPGREKNVTMLQRAYLDRVVRAGGVGAVITSLKQAFEVLELEEGTRYGYRAA